MESNAWLAMKSRRPTPKLLAKSMKLFPKSFFFPSSSIASTRTRAPQSPRMSVETMAIATATRSSQLGLPVSRSALLIA